MRVRGLKHGLDVTGFTPYLSHPVRVPYYVAHELSHIISWQRYRNGIHDKYFYKIFKKLCPEDLQLYELTYKRSASTKYGINGNIDIAMKKFNKKYKRVKKDYLTFF